MKRSLVMRNHRLLAKHKYQNEIPSRIFQYKVSYNSDNYKLEKGNNNTLDQLKKGSSNHVDDYLKSYKNRYSKKKGLSKLDCYCEKVLFNKFNEIKKLVEHKNYSKNKIVSIICLKYSLPFLLLTFIPLFELAMPKMVLFKVHSEKLIDCHFFYDTKDKREVKSVSHYDCDFYDVKAPFLPYVFLIISAAIILSLIIYIYIKFLKYKRINLGMLK
ncbi:hypothetical protein PVMG_06141 [Plasmodium vivax Mauritania I]|nr:hypothetical protein PVBG_05470 [Plasmodium vivax Brazil I]KMZ92498.1 hypothetical protein PVMG_06141 [Plasmodium vivax Mauritania I]KNA01549.1 hypothetical protein PVNG_04995 [Plasmodium vivax North Korean]